MNLLNSLKSKKKLLRLIGIILGGIAGYVYYIEVACKSGSCPLTSNPWISTIWAAVIGYLIADMFNKHDNEKPKREKPDQTNSE